ncbi:MAG: SpoIIE family protein phosphatase, partial [Planctomycetes bacterium]|nr:SpoIIE family protein phosphatase [Planctomycetota bacterium]
NASGEMFGFERLEEIIESGPHSSAEAMLEHLKRKVFAFTGQAEQRDDLTIVVVQA